MMNIVETNQAEKSLSQTLGEMNPLWGKHDGTHIAPVRSDLEEQRPFLNKKEVKKQGPTQITIVKQNDRTEVLQGHLERSQLRDLVENFDTKSKVQRETITASQIKTERMINHGDVQARVSSIWWKTYNLLFLVLAIYHGLVGMWDVLNDYNFSPLVRLTLYGSIVTVGLVLLVVGLLIIVPMGL
jgi:succinate dehydrogenase hydrophobic anchor subunit